MRTVFNLALIILCHGAFAQAFGRFGYAQGPQVPSISVDASGFAIRAAQADKLTFESPSRTWKALATSDVEQVVALDNLPKSPTRLRFNLLQPGFSMFCPSGLRLHVASARSPYLTWTEGSAGNGLSTPKLAWIALSFQTEEPPLIFGFPTNPCAVRIDGKAGDWTIAFEGVDSWVRVGALLGTRGISANSAYELGKLANAAIAQQDLYTGPTPSILKTTVESDLSAVTATWQFNRSGAVVPQAALLAGLGGYPLNIQTPIRHVDADSEEGPTDVVAGKVLTIRFPIRRVPTGRGVGLGEPADHPLGTAAPTDIPSVVTLALENLVASRDRATRLVSEQTFDEFFNQSEYAVEPWTGQQLPYGADGRGIDLAAAHALLSQAMMNASKSSSDANALLTSVSWRKDWSSWKIWTKDPVIGRRAGALLALAGALCPEPERRLQAALAQGGVAAERGLAIWMHHRNGAAPRPLIEPMYGLRQALFGLVGPVDPDTKFVPQLLSPLRVYGDSSIHLKEQDGRMTLSWEVVEAKSSLMTLASGYPIDLIQGVNFSHFKIDQALGITQLHFIPELAGLCTTELRIPKYEKRLPDAVAIPTYSEPAN